MINTITGVYEPHPSMSSKAAYGLPGFYAKTSKDMSTKSAALLKASLPK
jgi:hypothetical protein